MHKNDHTRWVVVDCRDMVSLQMKGELVAGSDIMIGQG